MAKLIDIRQGLTFHVRSENSQFYKYLKRIFNYSHIPFWDNCCSVVGTDRQPVAVNPETGGLVTYNGTDWSSFDTTPATITTNTINEQTSDNGVTVDGALIKDGGISVNNMFAGFFPIGTANTAQSLSGAGAVNVTSYLTKVTTTGSAQALSMANGTQIGQMKRIWHVVDGGSAVLTTALSGATTITFTTANEFADLIWTGTNWCVLSLGNFTATGASPALT